MAEPKLTREQVAKDDIALLFADVKFRRFLFTLRALSATEQPANNPDERAIQYLEGRRGFWCDVLFQVSQVAGPDALIRILEAELDTQKGTSSGRKQYDRLGTDDGNSGADERRPDPGDGIGAFLDYGSAD